jgi:hypothetical protein
VRQLLSKAESKAAAGGLPGRRHHVLTGVALPCTGLTRALDHCREFGLAYPSAAGGVQYSDAKVANRDARVSTARQRMALERWTNPKPQRRTRTRSPRYGVSPCRGKSAGVAKRPRELSHPKPLPSRFATFAFAAGRAPAARWRFPSQRGGGRPAMKQFWSGQ